MFITKKQYNALKAEIKNARESIRKTENWRASTDIKIIDLQADVDLQTNVSDAQAETLKLLKANQLNELKSINRRLKKLEDAMKAPAKAEPKTPAKPKAQKPQKAKAKAKEPELMTAEQLAEASGYSGRTLRTFLAQGVIRPVCKKDRRNWFNQEALDALLKRRAAN